MGGRRILPKAIFHSPLSVPAQGTTGTSRDAPARRPGARSRACNAVPLSCGTRISPGSDMERRFPRFQERAAPAGNASARPPMVKPLFGLLPASDLLICGPDRNTTRQRQGDPRRTILGFPVMPRCLRSDLSPFCNTVHRNKPRPKHKSGCSSIVTVTSTCPSVDDRTARWNSEPAELSGLSLQRKGSVSKIGQSIETELPTPRAMALTINVHKFFRENARR